ncbi:helix-turn-helix domain-containing protein [Steroidobacter sp.]|uniref:helix-turn-helix domain-containing protein n=1 Tax=Steroidobacter sp. TaxID=1978227 RepID=UPI001A5A9009|nr:helix-turn-helix domain-containing protein [Steroidobacter sp.]MBL8271609.1 helix-turn-helix domain-containing protein [Steroidobacter sp.]
MSDTQPASPKSPQIKKESCAYFAVLGKRVTQLRKSRSMTQAELARALGVSQQAVFAYEIGERRISAVVLERIAKLFRLTMDQLLGFTPEPARKVRLSPRAIRHAECLQSLSKMQQRFVVRILDVLEEHNKNSRKTGSAPQARN